MRVLAIAFFDPASVVLSHRNLMRAAGHDFRLAVVRAYTERQRQADYALEQVVEDHPTPGQRRLSLEKLSPDLAELREFAASADVIQFHPGIGHGDGDWASSTNSYHHLPLHEEADVLNRLSLLPRTALRDDVREVAFFHGSVSTWRHLDRYRAWTKLGIDWGHGEPILAGVAASTIDYATELDAAYLPPLVDVGDLRAPLRGDDDPLLVAHTPTDRVACSTEEFLKAARDTGVPVRLGEGLSHKDCLALKAECNAGFDHLRGAFSVNTLENAALGLVPLFALKSQYRLRLQAENVEPPTLFYHSVLAGLDASMLRSILLNLSNRPEITRAMQGAARRWWETYFSAEPIRKRLIKFYEGL